MASAPDIQAKAAERITWIGRDVRNWFASDFFDYVDHEGDLADFVTVAPGWVSGEDDLTPLGVAMYRQIKAAEIA